MKKFYIEFVIEVDDTVSYEEGIAIAQTVGSAIEYNEVAREEIFLRAGEKLESFELGRIYGLP